eukprot:scaffold1958_cov253-Pinguiococcus_pyrenoidosus.AAC.5
MALSHAAGRACDRFVQYQSSICHFYDSLGAKRPTAAAGACSGEPCGKSLLHRMFKKADAPFPLRPCLGGGC